MILNKIRHDPEFSDMAFRALDVLEKDPVLILTYPDERVEIPFMDIYCQAYRNDAIHFEDKVLTALAWQNILEGSLIYRFIQVRESPYRDKCIKENNDILLNMVKSYQGRDLYNIKEAVFWGGNQDADGFIEFSSPFIRDFKGRILKEKNDSKGKALVKKSVNGKCWHFPLEVGYCMPYQIEAAFHTNQCVARFPYGYDVIIFLEKIVEKDKGF